MNDAFNENEIKSEFDRASQRSEREIDRIYNVDIVNAVLNTSAGRISSKIVSEESSRVNDYITKLRQELRDIVINAVLKSGLSSTLTEIVWTKVISASGIPKPSLCSLDPGKNHFGPAPSPKSEDGTSQDRLAGYTRGRNIGIAESVTGAVIEAASFVLPSIEVLAFITVPSGIPITVLRVAGIVLLCKGGYDIYQNQVKINEISRLGDSSAKEEYEHKGIEEMIRTICLEQSRLNSKIITDWIWTVYKNTAAEIKNRLT